MPGSDDAETAATAAIPAFKASACPIQLAPASDSVGTASGSGLEVHRMRMARVLRGAAMALSMNHPHVLTTLHCQVRPVIECSSDAEADAAPAMGASTALTQSCSHTRSGQEAAAHNTPQHQQGAWQLLLVQVSGAHRPEWVIYVLCGARVYPWFTGVTSVSTCSSGTMLSAPTDASCMPCSMATLAIGIIPQASRATQCTLKHSFASLAFSSHI